MRVLVCGSRTWTDQGIVDAVLDGIYSNRDPYEEFVVIEGGAKGADLFAGQWARQWVPTPSHLVFPADWERHGKRAGFVRNQQMLDEGKPDLVLAFRSEGESRGTDMMVALARTAGIPVYVVTKP